MEEERELPLLRLELRLRDIAVPVAIDAAEIDCGERRTSH